MGGLESCEELVGERLPAFVRGSSKGPLDLGRIIGRRPLVLVFAPDLSEPECRAYVEAFERNEDHYRALSAAVIVVTAGASAGPGELPFAVAAGAGDLFAEYGVRDETGRLRAAVLIVDRYGQVDSAHVKEMCSELPEEPRVARLLLGAESLCPECGVAEDHWAEAAD